MNLGIRLRSILFISLLFPVLVSGQIAFFNFEDKSNYKGSWNLSWDIPHFFADYLREKYSVIVLSPATTEKLIQEEPDRSKLEILISNNINYSISGIIHDFSINRLVAGEPKVAQYETYANEIEIELLVTELKSNRIIFNEKLTQKSSELGVGVTIFGRESEAKREFSQLDQVKFGSEEFLQTLIGKNLLKLCDRFSIKIEPILNLYTTDRITDSTKSPTKTKFKRKIISGEILFVDIETQEVFINLGKKDNLEVGHILPVYAMGDTLKDSKTGEILGIMDKKIGEIEIIEVRGDRFSLGIIKEEKEKIIKGHKIRKIELLTE